MVRRDFTEVDLRRMLEHAARVRRSDEPGRHIVVTRHRRQAWHVVVEPDIERTCVIVVTAYPIEDK